MIQPGLELVLMWDAVPKAEVEPVLALWWPLNIALIKQLGRIDSSRNPQSLNLCCFLSKDSTWRIVSMICSLAAKQIFFSCVSYLMMCIYIYFFLCGLSDDTPIFSWAFPGSDRSSINHSMAKPLTDH